MDETNEIKAPRKRGRPRKPDSEKAAALPEAVRRTKQVRREENGECYGVTNSEGTGKYIESALEMWDLPKIDINDADQVEERVKWYFRHCGEKELKPSVAGLAVALDVDRRTLCNWANGERRNNQPHVPMIKRAINIILYNLEIYSQDGKMNPAIAIFLLKNHGGYTDQQQITLEAKQNGIEAPQMADVMDEYALSESRDE